MNTFTRMFVVAALALLAPLTARAQSVAQADDPRSGLRSAGAYIGGEIDQPDDWMVFGGDARLQINSWKIEINPRFTFRDVEDGSVFQFDANVLKNYDLARPGRLRPFVGVGAAIRKTSFDDDLFDEEFSDSSIGLNLVSGVRFAMSPGSGYEPFLHAQYTVLDDQDDVFSIVVGVSFSLRR